MSPLENARPWPHRYFFQDPIRFACMISAVLLVYSHVLTFWMTVAIVATVQLCTVSILARFLHPGWSQRWGTRLHSSVLSSRMCLDWSNFCACSLVGTLLLMRHFNGAEAVMPLGALILGICLLPDIRFCRWILADDWGKQSDHLRTGYFWRDPVKLGAMLSAAVVCLLDRGTLNFLLLSFVFLQSTTLLVFVDKYLMEIEVTKHRGLLALLLEGEGRRFAFCLSPIGLVPLRTATNDEVGWAGAALVASLIVLPDVARLLAAALRSAWRWIYMPRIKPTAAPAPRSIIWLVKP